jgi:hypothetical protein
MVFLYLLTKKPHTALRYGANLTVQKIAEALPHATYLAVREINKNKY